VEIDNRRVGYVGNQQATDFFAEVIEYFGFKTHCPEFECMDWKAGETHLTVDGIAYEATVSPYSLGCQVSAPLVVASTVEGLEGLDPTGKVLLLHGDITQEQLMPKNFTFYNPDHHKHIYQLLESKPPEAIIAATGRNPELAGGMYPFPLVEDGDFDIPSVYMKDVEGEKLVAQAGKMVSLNMQAERIRAKGCNVVARKGRHTHHRVVVCAHIDAKINSPGAIDNGGGTIVLLLLAELLADYNGDMGIEIVALNGEDYYAASGEVMFVESAGDRFDEIIMGINIDGAGYIQGDTAYSLYEPPQEIADLVHKAFASREDTIQGEQWYQSDQSLFLMNGRPAVAVTSDNFMELSTYITHTHNDSPEIIDTDKLADIAYALAELLVEMDRLGAYPVEDQTNI
jgi:aminopeptidase YwaD